jgi:hypothetical protein
MRSDTDDWELFYTGILSQPEYFYKIKFMVTYSMC